MISANWTYFNSSVQFLINGEWLRVKTIFNWQHCFIETSNFWKLLQIAKTTKIFDFHRPKKLLVKCNLDLGVPRYFVWCNKQKDFTTLYSISFLYLLNYRKVGYWTSTLQYLQLSVLQLKTRIKFIIQTNKFQFMV